MTQKKLSPHKAGTAFSMPSRYSTSSAERKNSGKAKH